MQWWGALTQQFSELAAKTMRDLAAEAGQAAVTPLGAGTRKADGGAPAAAAKASKTATKKGPAKGRAKPAARRKTAGCKGAGSRGGAR